jgi:transposase
MAKGKRYSQQFKEDAVKYRTDLPEMTLESTATYFGISVSALKHWLQIAKENNGMVVSRGSGNYSSDEEKGNCEVKTSAARCGRCS